MCVCVCVFWPPISTTCPNYEAVGFQPQAMDINDQGYLHTPSEFPSPPMLKVHASEYTKQTKDRKWAHLLATSVGSGDAPSNLGLYVLRLFFNTNEVQMAMTRD